MLQVMKPHLSATTQQQLVLTPQLRQAIHLLQLSTAELEAEVAEVVASNPLLDWVEDGDHGSETSDIRLAKTACTITCYGNCIWVISAHATRESVSP